MFATLKPPWPTKTGVSSKSTPHTKWLETHLEASNRTSQAMSITSREAKISLLSYPATRLRDYFRGCRYLNWKTIRTTIGKSTGYQSCLSTYQGTKTIGKITSREVT